MTATPKTRHEVAVTNRKTNRTATNRLLQIVESELKNRGVNGQEVAREARLPKDVFQSLRRGYRPNLDRADELCKALGITMMLGDERNNR